MSYDLAVWEGQHPADDEAGTKFYTEQIIPQLEGYDPRDWPLSSVVRLELIPTGTGRLGLRGDVACLCDGERGAGRGLEWS
jgi:hypothetical protein